MNVKIGLGNFTAIKQSNVRFNQFSSLSCFEVLTLAEAYMINWQNFRTFHVAIATVFPETYPGLLAKSSQPEGHYEAVLTQANEQGWLGDNVTFQVLIGPSLLILRRRLFEAQVNYLRYFVLHSFADIKSGFLPWAKTRAGPSAKALMDCTH